MSGQRPRAHLEASPSRRARGYLSGLGLAGLLAALVVVLVLGLLAADRMLGSERPPLRDTALTGTPVPELDAPATPGERVDGAATATLAASAANLAREIQATAAFDDGAYDPGAVAGMGRAMGLDARPARDHARTGRFEVTDGTTTLCASPDGSTAPGPCR